MKTTAESASLPRLELVQDAGSPKLRPEGNGFSRSDEFEETVRATISQIILPTYLPVPPDRNPMFLEKRVYQGSSGKVGPLGQRMRSHLALGRKVLESGEAKTAVDHFAAALTAPRNLGETRHLLANQSDIHFRLGGALEKSGDKKTARRHWLAAASFKGDFQEMSVRAFSEMTFYSALAREKLGQRAQAKKYCVNCWPMPVKSIKPKRRLISLPRRCPPCCCSTTTCNSGRKPQRCFCKRRRSLA